MCKLMPGGSSRGLTKGEREDKKAVLSRLLQGQQKPTSTRIFRMFLRGKEARGRDWESLTGPTLETEGHK